MPATLYLYAQQVRIAAGRYEAVDPRKFAGQESSWLAEHRAAMISAVSDTRQSYLKRLLLLELGEPALQYLTEIVHRRPREWRLSEVGKWREMVDAEIAETDHPGDHDRNGG